MRRIEAAVAAAALVLLAGCATSARLAAPPPVGPGPAGPSQASSQGWLEVYSAQPLADADVNMREFFWDDYLASNQFPRLPAHTDYTIYTRDGRVWRQVRNAPNPDSARPTRVPLPPGFYQIQAQAKGFSPQIFTVRMPVVIDPGRTTVLHLQGDWQPPVPYTEAQVVRLADVGIVGWRAAGGS